ncbi:MAG: hypothetical protein IKS83_05875 [Victivallales bacterium]|nr:hypothetical protein [Victivallales bacterium]
MRNRGTPISLFSFQDIITSLTGVMIIGILVIALQLVETINKKRSAPALDPEFEKMQQELADLRMRLRQASGADWELPDEQVREFRNQDETALKARLSQESQLVESRQQKAARWNDLADELEEETRRAEEEQERRHQQVVTEQGRTQEQLQDQLAKLKDAEKQAEERNQRLRQELQRTRDAIVQKERSLAFSFVGQRTHTPILVECTGKGFRAAVYPPEPGQVMEFQGRSFAENLNEFTAWLKGFDFSLYYPVLLYRADAIARSNEIDRRIKALSPDIVLGRDPVMTSLEIFPEK